MPRYVIQEFEDQEPQLHGPFDDNAAVDEFLHESLVDGDLAYSDEYVVNLTARHKVGFNIVINHA